jgi:hypothetical protein
METFLTINLFKFLLYYLEISFFQNGVFTSGKLSSHSIVSDVGVLKPAVHTIY